MRSDGREKDELRPVTITPNYLAHPEGSVLIEMGKTRVICAATVEETIPRWLRGQAQGWITAEYALLPRATHRRTPRETRGLRGRTQEIRRMIGRSLRAGFDLRYLNERTITLDCDVIQADGGTRTAAITGGYVAIALALNKLVRAGVIKRPVFLPPVAAISVGIVQGEILLDLCYEEDSQAEVDLNVAMNRRHRYVEIQGTAEGQPFERTQMESLLDLAQKGIIELLEAQKEILEG